MVEVGSVGRESSALDFRSVGARCSNWGRWGADDERGTLNLITEAAVARAAAAGRDSPRSTSCIAICVASPQPGCPGRREHRARVARLVGASDV